MPTQLAPLTFEGGVNLKADPHLLKPNEWLKLQNMWPYKDKFIGSRPSLLHEQEILPVDNQYWNSWLFNNDPVLPVLPYPTKVKYYSQWFRHLTPLKSIFLGDLNRLALICVCNYSGKVKLYEKFEGSDATIITLDAGEVVLIMLPNDLKTNPVDAGTDIFPMLSGVRLGRSTNITPTLIEFNGIIVAANKGCEYVVKVVHSDTLEMPSDTTWPSVDYRFMKMNFGDTNGNFRADGAIVYKNRFVYWKGNKLWVSDPFQPELIYLNAVDTAYLGVFFNTGLTEDITALGIVFVSDKELISQTKLAIWTQHGMLTMSGEPATTIASTPEEIWTLCTVADLNIPAGCVSGASVVKTKYGLVWCGAESVWFMQGDATPIEVGYKIGPRIAAQSFESAGRIFATFDDLCYRLVINEPGVGFNPYDALNEMWCLSFIGDNPTKENAAWFGPQTFGNIDNSENGTLSAGGNPGLYCCAKLTNINDDKTWYIQPFTYALAESLFGEDINGTRLGLASLTYNLGVDITAPFEPVTPIVAGVNYNVGSIFHNAGSSVDDGSSYAKEYMVVIAGVLLVDLMAIPILKDGFGTAVCNKRILTIYTEQQDRFPQPFKISVQGANLTFDNPDLEKLIDGYELTFKTLNPIIIKSWWAPWQPTIVAANNVILESKVNIASKVQNQLDNMFNEPVLTSRLITAPPNKRFNGLEAQLNIEDSDYTIIAADNVTNPKWNKIRLSTDNVNFYEFNLFDFDDKGIAKYESLFELIAVLQTKVLTATGSTLDYTLSLERGIEFRLITPTKTLYIDLTAEGWEWFGFLPSGINLGHGVDILTNVADNTQFIKATGPSPLYTPKVLHFTKINVRYDTFEARPR